jgi:S-adenosylmethionine synthetase
VQYESGKPKRIDTVVISHQHDDEITRKEIERTIIDQVVRPVLDHTGLLDDDTNYYINPTGRFVVGGPHGDTGLTGRKIIVDTYGGMGRHGGGAFSGKDPSKVDRSAAYMARYVAKNIVAAGLAERAEVGLAYAIGVPFPVSVRVDTFGTGVIPEEELERGAREVFDLTPAGIISSLNLQRPIFRQTSTYGHFGRSLPNFTWEKTDKVDELREMAQAASKDGKELAWTR